MKNVQNLSVIDSNGYALLAYKMLTEAGIECRIIDGKADNGEAVDGHAWNLVRVKDKWYYMDVTWDDCLSNYKYFLVGEKTMDKDHMPDKEYQTKQFRDYYNVEQGDYPGVDRGDVPISFSLSSIITKIKRFF